MSRRALFCVAILLLATQPGCCFTFVSGCCSGIAKPNFDRFQCRSKQAEAKGNLKALAAAEQAYFATHQRFTDDQTALGFTPKGETVRYRYTITAADETSFVAVANGKDEMDGDVWQVTNAQPPVNLVSVCGDKPKAPPPPPDGVSEVRY